MSPPKPDWQAGDLRLTAPEMYVLSHEEVSNEFVFRLAVQEFLLRKALEHSKPRGGVRGALTMSILTVPVGALVMGIASSLFEAPFVAVSLPLGIATCFLLCFGVGLSKQNILQKGPHFEMSLSRSLSVVRDRFRLERPQTFAGRIKGVYPNLFVRSTQRYYSVERDVFPVLVERGLYRTERVEASQAGSENLHVLTPSGGQARDAILQSLATADRHFRDWVEQDPARTVRFVAQAGFAMLLVDRSVREDIQRLNQLPELAEFRRSGSATVNASLTLEFMGVSSELIIRAVGELETTEQASDFIEAINALADAYRVIDPQPGAGGHVGDGGGGGHVDVGGE